MQTKSSPSPDDRITRKTFLLSIIVAIWIVFVEEWYFQKPQGYQLLVWLGRDVVNRGAVIVTTLLSFCTLVFFLFLLLSLARKFRIILVFFYAVPLLVQIVCWEVFHRSISTSDINIALNSLSYFHSATQIYFNPLVVIPVIVLILILMIPPGSINQRRVFQLSLFILAMVVANTGIASLKLQTNWGTSVPKFYETLTRYLFSDIHQVKRAVVSKANLPKPNQNIVLIIDESIRSDHLSLNGYSRSTTPYLDLSAQDTLNFHNWGTISSGATCSPLSNALLITGVQVSPASYGNLSDDIQKYPTLFQYAKAMGYHTTYYDGQTNYLWNGLGLSDLQYIDEWIKTTPDENDHTVDIRAADWIKRTLSKSTGNFIVLNKKGAHYMYENSYPDNAAIWGPAPTNYLQQPKLVDNVYDNAIHFSVNTFFEHLLSSPNANAQKTIYVWTSDHSQTLFENGATWSHCNFYPIEASVPLIIIGNLPVQPNLNFQASHANIFPTLLDLMGVPLELRRFPYAPSLLINENTANQQHRYFVSGDGSIIDFDQGE